MGAIADPEKVVWLVEEADAAGETIVIAAVGQFFQIFKRKFLVVGVFHGDLKSKRTKLVHQNLEAFGNTGFGEWLALNDAFVCLHTSVDIVRLAGEKLL
jgi:hypothetical protein